jgi:4-hydroxybenzoate polyprenyltransferase
VSALRFYRVSDWVHFLGFVFLGILFGERSGNFNVPHMFEVVVASSLLLAFAYSFNVLCDSELESSVRLSRKAVISDHPRGLLLSFFPAAVALMLVAWSMETALLGLLVLLVWALYSFPQPRLKAIPILCTTHYEGDTMLGDKTTAVQCGVKRSVEGAVLSLAGAILLLAAMYSQGIINTLAALSAGSFAVIFILVFLSEYKNLNQTKESVGLTLIARFRSLRAKYKYGGILVGVLLACALLT